MDYGTYRGIYTIIMMIVFGGIIWWAYSNRSKSKFDDAANSIFEDDEKVTDSKKDKAHQSEQTIDKDLRK